jgi:hypothetical protein
MYIEIMQNIQLFMGLQLVYHSNHMIQELSIYFIRENHGKSMVSCRFSQHSIEIWLRSRQHPQRLGHLHQHDI